MIWIPLGPDEKWMKTCPRCLKDRVTPAFRIIGPGWKREPICCYCNANSERQAKSRRRPERAQ